MKKEFFDIMLEIMRDNKNVYLLFCGLGYPRMDEFLKEFPDRAFNFEASEQTALDAAVGLAYAGKIPFVYTITPFLLRGFETIRTYINHENLNIKLVGAGRKEDYSKSDGYSHDAKDIEMILNTQKNIDQYYPDSEKELRRDLLFISFDHNPAFISLRR